MNGEVPSVDRFPERSVSSEFAMLLKIIIKLKVIIRKVIFFQELIGEGCLSMEVLRTEFNMRVSFSSWL